MNAKQSLFVLLLLLLTATLESQSQESIFGFKAGVNFSSIASGQFNQEGIPRVGILIGVVSEFPVSPEFSFAPELLFSQKGNLIRFDENGTNSTIGTHLNYITVPLQFKYYLNPRFSIDLGPYVGANVSANSVVKSGGQRVSDKIAEGVNFFDAGLGGSIGYSFGGIYFISGRYSRSLSAVFNDTADSFGRRARNSVFNLSFGLYL